jgi:predicted DNA-binding protein
MSSTYNPAEPLASVPHSTSEETVRFTLDLPLSLHHELSTLAKRLHKSKAVLVRFAMTQLSAQAIAPTPRSPTPLSPELTKRFTVDVPLSIHEAFSILAIRQRKSKADLLRGAIAQMIQDLKEGKSVK